MEDYKKKYEQALDNFKKIKAANKDNKELVDFIEYKYPELIESDDEKIRKGLIQHLKELSKVKDLSHTPIKFKQYYDVWISWLEKQGELVNSLSRGLDNAHERIDGLIQKNNSLIEQLEKNQGEQKPTDEIKPKFKVGDKVIIHCDAKREQSCHKIYDSKEGVIDCIYSLVNNPWGNIGVVLPNKCSNTFWESELELKDKQKPSWSENDERKLLEIKCLIGNYRTGNDEYELCSWIDNLKKRVRPQPKQEWSWSEDDEKKIDLLIAILEVNHPNGQFKVNPINTSNMEAMSTEEIVNWLKSLKERVQPKQKYEQNEEDGIVLNSRRTYMTLQSSNLMIGDWMRCNDPNPFRIKYIDGVDERIYGDDGFWVDIKDLRPIPLTAEILEKNGFTYVTSGMNDSDELVVSVEYGVFQRNTDNGFKMLADGKAIEYVHELQHALRLCGVEKEIEL